MALMSFVAMYILMYMMVDTYANVYPNLNQFYMAGIMTMPMIMIELLFMGSMYNNKRLNQVIIISSASIFLLLFFLLRKQIAIGDKEFLKSMIPHHAGALLMCKNAQLQDPDVINLCRSIKASQQSEIDFMKEKLASLK